MGGSGLPNPMLGACVEEELEQSEEEEKGHEFVDLSDELFVSVAVIGPCKEEGEIEEREEEEGGGEIGELVVDEVGVAVRPEVVGLEMEGHRDGGVGGAVEEEDEVEIGDGEEDGLVEVAGVLVEGEDGEDEGVGDDAGVVEEGVAGGGGPVEAAHGGEGGGVGVRDGHGGDGDGDEAGAVEPEVLEEDQGAGVGSEIEGFNLGCGSME